MKYLHIVRAIQRDIETSDYILLRYGGEKKFFREIFSAFYTYSTLYSDDECNNLKSFVRYFSTVYRNDSDECKKF